MMEIRQQARDARRRGDRAEAARQYQHLLQLAPSDLEARWGARILGEDFERHLVEDGVSAPLVPHARCLSFLGPEDRQRIEGYLHAHLPDLAPATIFRDGKRQLAAETRSARVLIDPGDIPAWFGERVLEALPLALARLGEHAFRPERMELHLSLSLDSDFYAPHTDDTTGYDFRLPHVDSRKISFVYYLFHSPARFTGGELRLYDRCESLKSFDAERYTSVVPQDDMLVFFPSSRFHGVGPVSLASDDPRDGRFTINGWLHAGPQPA